MTSIFLSNTFVLLLILLQFLSAYILNFIYIPPEYIFLFLPSLLYVYFTKQNFKDVFQLKKLSLKNVVILVILALLIQPAMQTVGIISSFIFPNNVNLAMLNLNKYPLLMTLFMMALTPAICEELAFRGVFYFGYKDIDIKKAVVMNGLMFGIIHFDGQQLLYAFLMGNKTVTTNLNKTIQICIEV